MRRTLAAALLSLLLATSAIAASRHDEPPSVGAFVEVPGTARVVRQPVEALPDAGRFPADHRVPSMRPASPVVRGSEPPVRRPVVATPSPHLIVVNVGSPQPSSYRASGTASWCAPTPRYCHGWGGDAHVAAVESFRYGDARYTVRVCGTKGCTTVTVVSYGVLPKGRIIDLSPAAFEEACGPTWMGVCAVKVTGLR